MAKPYRLWKRGKTYYYRLPGATWKSTGCSRQAEAIDFVLLRIEEAKTEAARRARAAVAVPLRDYLKPFYTVDCPHVARLRAEKKQIGQSHIKNQRALLDRYILPDAIAGENVNELRRGHLLDFRGRLLARGLSDRQVNRILGALKTCLREGIYREELKHDPGAGIGNIHHEAEERGVFTREELRRLFPAEGLGPWEDLQAFACFQLAAAVGLRRGEVLALRWRDLDFDKKQLHVRQAWKSDKIIGPPKWGKVREELPLPAVTVGRLKQLRAASLHVLPDALVFHNPNGSRKSTLWWREAFAAAMVNAKIPAGTRTAHCLRHSLATALKDLGVDDAKIQAAMGWSSARMQKQYTHLSGEHLRGQADLVDGILDGGRDGGA
jgi:integrase